MFYWKLFRVFYIFHSSVYLSSAHSNHTQMFVFLHFLQCLRWRGKARKLAGKTTKWLVFLYAVIKCSILKLISFFVRCYACKTQQKYDIQHLVVCKFLQFTIKMLNFLEFLEFPSKFLTLYAEIMLYVMEKFYLM